MLLRLQIGIVYLFFPILGEGEALIVGVDFPMPLTIKIDVPPKAPDSQTPKLKKKNSKYHLSNIYNNSHSIGQMVVLSKINNIYNRFK